MDPLHEKLKVTRIALQPNKGVAFSLIAHLPRRIGWIRGVLVVVTLEVAWNYLEWFLEDNGTACGMSGVFESAILTYKYSDVMPF